MHIKIAQIFQAEGLLVCVVFRIQNILGSKQTGIYLYGLHIFCENWADDYFSKMTELDRLKPVFKNAFTHKKGLHYFKLFNSS